MELKTKSDKPFKKFQSDDTANINCSNNEQTPSTFIRVGYKAYPYTCRAN
jgi:hypothetical protein